MAARKEQSLYRGGTGEEESGKREENYSKSCITGNFVAPSVESSRGCRLQAQLNLDLQVVVSDFGPRRQKEGKL